MAKRKTITIRDIARESGASLTTVSLVLNNRDGRISQATRSRVLETVTRLGYRPSRLAQGLQSRRAGILAILVPELRHAFADAYVGELISAAHDHARRSGYKMLLEVADMDYVSRGQHRELFDRLFVDGMLCIGVTSRDEYLKDFEDGARPMVVVNNYLEQHNLNFVRCDYAEAGRLGAQYLIGLGHSRIGYIHGAMEVRTTWDFRAGLEQALHGAGLKLPPHRVADGRYTEEGGAEAAFELLRRDPAITAVVAGNDKMAIGAMNALIHAGKRVPRDISIIGCDDLHLAKFTNPPLTTIKTPLYELGIRACRALLELVEGRIDSVREIQQVELVVRDSVCAPTKTT